MPRPATNTNSLARGRVRASMNKYNLFNLYKKPQIRHQGRSLYQQKWTAKQETRAYHGEHLTEGRWKQIFDPNLNSVAQLDASLKGNNNVEETPVSLQTYAVLEKRLEFALFRSMFASSIRQARQFILGGYVEVNGITIKHPSFPLKSGDIFHVKPDRVLMALGRSKPSLAESIKVDNKQIIVWNEYVKNAKKNPREVWQLKQLKPKSLDTLSEFDNSNMIEKINKDIDNKMKNDQKKVNRESILSKILKVGKGEELKDLTVFNSLYGKENASKCFEIYRRIFDTKHTLLTKNSVEQCRQQIIKKSNEYENSQDFKFMSKIKQILNEINKSYSETVRLSAEQSKLSTEDSSKFYDPGFASKLTYHEKINKDEIMEDESKAKINLPWQKSLFGRQDPSKPYFTPWTPRPFLGAFSILPSHIEISFATCHGIYLRDPVARPGHSEVITPFPTHVHKRAYMYYVRKGM